MKTYSLKTKVNLQKLLQDDHEKFYDSRNYKSSSKTDGIKQKNTKKQKSSNREYVHCH